MLIVRNCCAECVTPASNVNVNGSVLSIVTERPGEVMVWGAAKRFLGWWLERQAARTMTKIGVNRTVLKAN